MQLLLKKYVLRLRPLSTYKGSHLRLQIKWLWWTRLFFLINAAPALATDTPTPTSSPLRDLIVQKLESQPALRLDLFVMSQCPYGVRAEEALIPIVKEFAGQIDFQLHYIVASVGAGQYQSLHGPAEVAENTRQLLIARHFPRQWLDYLLARARNYQTDDWQTAAREVGIDVQALTQLERQTRPDELLLVHARQTQQRNIRLSPSIFVNDEWYQGPIQPKLPVASTAKNSMAVSCTTNGDCNDNNLCTTDACDNGQCVFTSKNCDDNNNCTTDACNRDTGGCVYNLKTCNDNNANTGDYCDSQTGGCIYVPCSGATPVSLTSQSPVNSIACLGSALSLSVSATATGPLTYQWYRNGNVLTDVNSATTATLSLTNVQVSNEGSYSVSVSDICSNTASSVFNLSTTTVATPATILTFVADERACPVRLLGQGVGTSFVFTNASGYVFSNVFRVGGTHDLSGLGVKQPGTYTLMATSTNECGSSAPVSQLVTVGRSCP